MTLSLPRLAALLAALALAGAGVLQIAHAISGDRHLRAPVAVPGPTTIYGQQVQLLERTPAAGGYPFVDVQVAERVVPGTSPVWIDRQADANDYRRRYAGRFELFAPVVPGTTSWQLLEFDHAAARGDRVRYRVIEIAPDGDVGLHTVDAGAVAARATLARVTLGSALPSRFFVPAPAMLLAAGVLVALAWPRRLPAAWPTLLLGAGMAALASLVAWPLMLEIGLARTLVAPILACGVSLLLALAVGPRPQAAAASATRGRAVLVGVVTALALMAVFIVVQVSANGFIAPVFRPPGGALTPTAWFVRDYIAPSLALASIGVPLALMAGACYGVTCRRWPLGDVR